MICPHCRKTLADAPDLAGQLVKCPECGETFGMSAPRALLRPVPPAMPVRPVIQAGYPQPAPQQPVIFVNTAPHSHPRLHPGGWFSRSFSSASGVLLAVLAFIAIIVGVPILLVCGGGMMLKSQMTAANVSYQQEVDTVKKLALPHLKKHRLAEISSDAILTGEFKSPIKTLTGSARGDDGRIHIFSMDLKVATFEKRRQWQVESLEIDGETVYTRE